jgi:hypothetical protein
VNSGIWRRYRRCALRSHLVTTVHQNESSGRHAELSARSN